MYDHVQNAAVLAAICLIVLGAWLRYGTADALMVAGVLLIALIFLGRILR